MTTSTQSWGRRLIHFIASGFGSGWAPKAPGTFGTLVAIPIYLLLRECDPTVYVVVTIAMFALGVWVCDVAARDWGDDSPRIVWDEIVGYLIAMFMVPIGWGWVASGFVLFRVLDIAKPAPIRTVDEHVRGGLGTMLDDALAGLAVLGLLHLAALYIK